MLDLMRLRDIYDWSALRDSVVRVRAEGERGWAVVVRVKVGTVMEAGVKVASKVAGDKAAVAREAVETGEAVMAPEAMAILNLITFIVRFVGCFES